MEKKSVLGLGVFLVFLLVVGSLGYNIFLVQKENTQDEQKDTVQEISEDEFNLEYNYIDENLWRYSVTGTLPNPCYTISTESIVMESYPEQVIIKSTVTPPQEDMICTQVIQEVYEEGEFVASEDAEVSFSVDFTTL
jgi:hypothetical protein